MAPAISAISKPQLDDFANVNSVSDKSRNSLTLRPMKKARK
jgi:hypothetical protein